jgi:hypothetical protein
MKKQNPIIDNVREVVRRLRAHGVRFDLEWDDNQPSRYWNGLYLTDDELVEIYFSNDPNWSRKNLRIFKRG